MGVTILSPRGSAAAILIAASVVSIAAGEAKADSIVALGGLDFDANSFYGYVGGIGRLDGTFSGSGWVARVWADRLTYNYVSGSTLVRASSWGQSASLGYSYNYPTGQLSGYLGVDSRYRSFEPSVTSSFSGERVGARMELDFSQQVAPKLDFDASGSFVTSTSDYWTRAQLLYTTPVKGIAVGPEVVGEGNTQYAAYRVGLAATRVPLLPGVSLAVSAGYDKTINLSGGAYCALSFAKTF